MLNNKSKLDDLDGRSEDLMLGAIEFDKLGKDLKRKIWLEKMRIVAALSVAGLVLSSQPGVCPAHILFLETLSIPSLLSVSCPVRPTGRPLGASVSRAGWLSAVAVWAGAWSLLRVLAESHPSQAATPHGRRAFLKWSAARAALRHMN